MLTSRRAFLRTATAAAAAPILAPRVLDTLERRLEAYANLSAEAATTDEAFWAEIHRAEDLGDQ